MYEVVEVTFDEPLDLILHLRACGEQVGPKVPVVEHLSLTAAVARMPFIVLVPTRVPDPEHSRSSTSCITPHADMGVGRIYP